MERWPAPGPQDALVVARARMAQQEAAAAKERLMRRAFTGDLAGATPDRAGLRGSLGRLLIRIGTALADERPEPWSRDGRDPGLA